MFQTYNGILNATYEEYELSKLKDEFIKKVDDYAKVVPEKSKHTKHYWKFHKI